MVMPGSSFFKDFFRTLIRSITRFLSIMAITALGVGFFAGITATEPDMILSADRYYQDQQLADFTVISPLGFLPEDIEQIRQLNGVAIVQPGYMSDVFLSDENGLRITVRLNSHAPADQLNQPLLLKGRLPENPGEIALDGSAGQLDAQQNGQGIQLGDLLKASLPNGSRIEDALSETSFTVVGFIQSPRYISYSRGQTSIGDGKIDAYAIVLPEAFALERVPQVCVRTADSVSLSAYSTAYKAHLVPVETQLASLGKAVVGAETRQLRDELNEAKETLLQNKQTAEKELADASQALEEARVQLEDGEREIAEKEETYQAELAYQKRKLDDAREDYLDGMMAYIAGHDQWLSGYLIWQDQRDRLNQADLELADAKNQLDQGERELAQAREQLGQARVQLDMLQGALAALQRIRAAVPEQNPGLSETEFARLLDAVRGFSPELAAYIEAYYKPDEPDMLKQLADFLDAALIQVVQAEKEGRTEYEAGQADYEAGVRTLNQKKKEYEEGRRQVDSGLAALSAAKNELDRSKSELDSARGRLDRAKKQLDDGEIELIRAELKLQRELEKGRAELALAQKELADAAEQLETEQADARSKIAAAEAEIRDAERSLVEIPVQWFVFTRETNPGYSGFGDDARRIGAVARVFPLFFFLVAALVCLTTMTRMIEEERVQIGTLKALGYGNLAISLKYLLYALLAGLLGSMIGLWTGFNLFPAAIMRAYAIMYQIPAYYTPVHLDTGIISLGMALLTILAATLGASLKELKAVPAVLMQPRAPRAGKRIFLEYVKPIWQRLSFSQKLAARNVFRYKQRLLMTVIGIAGCTALLLTGFGLKDSISSIVGRQFESIFLFDGQVLINTEEHDASRTVNQMLAGHPDIASHMLLLSESVTVMQDDVSTPHAATLIVPEDDVSFDNYYDLHERISGQKLSLFLGGAIISEKLAELLGMRVGDILSYSDAENRTYSLPVSGIMENYLSHFIFMSADTFDRLTYRTPAYNAAVFNTAEPSAFSGSDFQEAMLSSNAVLGSFLTAALADDFSQTLGSLNLVVAILILAAGALAFVVLYNLISINITERIREIATIKVLGFRNSEVSAYVFRENIVLTILGALTGLLLGIVLHRFVMNTMEIDAMMFGKSIHWLSYLYAALLTLFFSMLVNLFMHIRLQKIKMVESLKAVD